MRSNTTTASYQITDEDIQWLNRYLTNAAPSGNEVQGQQIWLERMNPLMDDCLKDAYGNVAAIINPGQPFKVVLEAHADEIAWYVHTITKDGFLHVEKNGGSDPGIAPSQRVRIHTETGVAQGIFGWPAVHIRSAANEKPKADSIFVDCGCRTRKEVEALGIQVGDCVTYDTTFGLLNDNYFVGRGQDNKMGGFMLTAVARLLREENIKLPYSLYFVNAVQEEVGLHGAGMMANAIRPSCAIVTDVIHATRTPLVSSAKLGDLDLGEGPVVVKAPPIHNKLREFIVNTARQNEIQVQLAVKSKKSGTDADAFAYTGKGIPTALISLPLRYMHTTVETTAKRDVENTINLLFAVLTQLKPDFDFSYF